MAKNIRAVRRSYFSCHARVCERTSERTLSASLNTHKQPRWGQALLSALWCVKHAHLKLKLLLGIKNLYQIIFRAFYSYFFGFVIIYDC